MAMMVQSMAPLSGNMQELLIQNKKDPDDVARSIRDLTHDLTQCVSQSQGRVRSRDGCQTDDDREKDDTETPPKTRQKTYHEISDNEDGQSDDTGDVVDEISDLLTEEKPKEDTDTEAPGVFWTTWPKILN